MADIADTVTVESLTDTDLIADVAALINGADDVDGIEISDVEYDDLGITITLVDANGDTRNVAFALES